MFSQPATGRAQLTVLLLLATLTVGAFCTRIVAIAEPLGIDQSLWASAANGMAHGQRLYRDVWEQRPPGIYWIYEAGFRLLGSTPATVVWLDILASAATCLLLFLIARSLSTPLTAALAAALYAVLTMPSWLYGYGGFLERSVCETFIATCVAIATYAAVHVAKRRSLAASFVLGLAAGAAVVLKPNAGLYFPALLLWIVSFGGMRGMVAPGITAMAGGAVVPALAILWLWRLDLLLDARTAVLDFNRYYVGQGFVPGGYLVNFAKAVWLRIKTDPLWLAGIIGAGVAVFDLVRRRTMAPLAALASVLGAAAVIVIVVNGARLFNSYFINALVPLSLMAAWWLGDAAPRTRPRQAIATVTVLAMLTLLISRGYVDRVFGSAAADLAQLRGQVDNAAYLDRFGGYAINRGYSARANAELADYVRARTSADERVFLIGISGAGVYFLSDRLTAHRFLRVNFFIDTDFPDPEFRLEPVLAGLAVSRPRYIIFEQLHGQSTMAKSADALPDDPRVLDLLKNYHLETRIEDFTLYRRSD